MVSSIELTGLLIATILGALISAVLGWKDAVDKTTDPNPFDIKKFWPSIVRSIISALTIFAATYTGFANEVTVFTYILAFLAGAGIDSAGNKISGIIQKK